MNGLTTRFIWPKLIAVVAFAASCATGDAVYSQGEVKLHRKITEADIKRPGEDWPQFLGPRNDGTSSEDVLKSWPAGGLPILWEKEIGTGYSAPSVRGHRLVIHHRLGNKEIIECLRSYDGKQIWTHTYETTYSDPYGYNNGPRCSPLLTEKHCYTFGAQGILTCVELETGKPVWNRRCEDDFELPQWFFGIGCTPVLEGGLLIALVGGQPNSGVVAFDALTGKTVWQAVGKQTWDGAQTGAKAADEAVYKWTGEEQIVSYSSPIVATIHGKRHLLCFLRHGLVSLDPKTGQQNFKHWFRARSFESVNAARPLVIGDKIFLSAAYRKGSGLIQVNPDNKSYKVLWEDSRNLLTHWSTAMHVDGFIYGFSGRHEQEGEFRAIDAKTGKVAWKTTGYTGELANLGQDPATGKIIDKTTKKEVPWPFYGRGSKIKIGNNFLVLGERGTLALVKVNSEKFEELGRTSYRQIRYPAWAAPVLSRGRVYLRSEDNLICLDLPPKP